MYASCNELLIGVIVAHYLIIVVI